MLAHHLKLKWALLSALAVATFALASLNLVFTQAAFASGPNLSDWQITCDRHSKNDTRINCRMAQSLLNQRENKPLLVVRIFVGKHPSLLLQTPLQVFLKAGVVVQVDKGKRYAFAYEFCNLEGCYAGVPLPNSLLTSFRRGKTAVFKLTDTQGKQASFDISLKGFTKTYDELSGKN